MQDDYEYWAGEMKNKKKKKNKNTKKKKDRKVKKQKIKIVRKKNLERNVLWRTSDKTQNREKALSKLSNLCKDRKNYKKWSWDKKNIYIYKLINAGKMKNCKVLHF